MTSDITVNKMRLDCPICGQNHEVELYCKNKQTTSFNRVINYGEVYCFCSNIAGIQKRMVG